MPEDKELIIQEPLSLNPVDLKNANTWEDFISLWTISQEIDMRNQWFKGDIADRVAVVHGDGSLSKFADDVHEKRVTLESCRRVSRAFPEDTRNLNLSWTHYFLASFTDSYKKGEAKFEGQERHKWIQKASDESWSTTRLAVEIKKDHALVADKQSVFNYYDDYLAKVNHVLLHIEKDKLTKDEAEKLLDKFMGIYNDFTIYLDTIKQVGS